MGRVKKIMHRAGWSVLGVLVMAGALLSVVFATVVWALLVVRDFIVPFNRWDPNDPKRRRWDGVQAGAEPIGRVLKMTVWDCGLQEGRDGYPEVNTWQIVAAFEFVRDELFYFHPAFSRNEDAVEMWVEKIELAGLSDRMRLHEVQIQQIGRAHV